MKTKVLISYRKTRWVVLISLSFFGFVRLRARARQGIEWICERIGSCRVRAKLVHPLKSCPAAQFSPDHWYKTTVPSTVLAAQVADGEFKDIYFGDNLRKLPGMDYPVGELFSNHGSAELEPLRLFVVVSN